jgi:hypothetical protein
MITGLIVGLVLGATFGTLVACLCFAVGSSNAEHER